MFFLGPNRANGCTASFSAGITFVFNKYNHDNLNFVIQSDLIAPFIPIGLCGSLLVCGGGLSLLFPNCQRKPLPNTLEEAENKRLPASLKHRYPSFRDLKNGKIYSVPVSGNGLNGNVYTIAPNVYDKTNVKQHSDINQNHNFCEQKLTNGLQRQISATSLTGLTHMRPTALFNEDTESRISDLEEYVNESNNWRLFPNEFSSEVKTETHTKLDPYVNRTLREVDIMSRPSFVANRQNGLTSNIRRIQSYSRDSVAETNL